MGLQVRHSSLKGYAANGGVRVRRGGCGIAFMDTHRNMAANEIQSLLQDLLELELGFRHGSSSTGSLFVLPWPFKHGLSSHVQSNAHGQPEQLEHCNGWLHRRCEDLGGPLLTHFLPTSRA